MAAPAKLGAGIGCDYLIVDIEVAVAVIAQAQVVRLRRALWLHDSCHREADMTILTKIGSSLALRHVEMHRMLCHRDVLDLGGGLRLHLFVTPYAVLCNELVALQTGMMTFLAGLAIRMAHVAVLLGIAVVRVQSDPLRGVRHGREVALGA